MDPSSTRATADGPSGADDLKRLGDILQETLDKAEALTGSTISFFHLVDPDEKGLTLQAWSVRTLTDACSAEAEGRHYPVSKAGLWAEPIRTHKAAIHNDYARMRGKKGLPAGHAELTRELVAPVTRGGRVIALMGVGNKPTDYTDVDVIAVEAMAQVAADVALHSRAQAEFERFFDLVPDLVCIVTADGLFRRVNSEWQRALGYSSEQMVGHTFLEFVHPDDRESTTAVFDREFSGQGANGFENRYRAADGTFRVLEWSSSPAAADGLVFAVARDITVPRMAEDAIRDSQQRLQALLDNAPYGAHIWELQDDDRLIFIGYNKRAVEMLGIDHEALLGQTIEEAFPGNIGTPTPDAYRKVAREGGTWESAQSVYDSGEISGVFEVYAFSFLPKHVSVFFRDVTELHRTELKLQASEAELRKTVERLAKAVTTLTALSACNEALVRAESEDSLLSDICTIAVEQGGYLMTWVGYVEYDEAHSLRPVASAGRVLGYLDEIAISWSEDAPTGQGIGGTAVRTRERAVANSVTTDPLFTPWKHEALARGYNSAAAFPLMLSDGTPLGAIMFYAAEEDRFGEGELALLSELSSDLAFGIETLRARGAKADMADQLLTSNQRLESLLRQITVALGRAVEARDPYTSGHEERVAALARQIAEAMDLKQEEVDAVEIAGLVHDIGKLSIPAEILTKPSALSALEIRLIREHSRTGYEILKDIAFALPIADIVLQHHERIDGTGYPDGITGDRMLLPAKILAVADVVEAMASHRPYRAARGLDEAIDEISTHPELYDADVAAVCVGLHTSGAIKM